MSVPQDPLLRQVGLDESNAIVLREDRVTLIPRLGVIELYRGRGEAPRATRCEGASGSDADALKERF